MNLPAGFAAYILFSPSRDTFYIGQCGDLRNRLQEHLEGTTRSTSGAKDWELHFFQACSTRSEAMHLEQTIKRKKSRKSTERFIRDPRNQCPHPIPLDSLVERPDLRRSRRESGFGT